MCLVILVKEGFKKKKTTKLISLRVTAVEWRSSQHCACSQGNASFSFSPLNVLHINCKSSKKVSQARRLIKTGYSTEFF